MDFYSSGFHGQKANTGPIIKLNNDDFLEKIRTSHGWMLQLDSEKYRYFLMTFDGEKFALYESEDLLTMEFLRFQQFATQVAVLVSTPEELQKQVEMTGKWACTHCWRKLIAQPYGGKIIYSDLRGTVTCDKRPRTGAVVLHEPIAVTDEAYEMLEKILSPNDSEEAHGPERTD